MPSRKYIVQPCDSLSVIAQRLGVSLLELQVANPQVLNPNVVHPGDELNIPGGTAATSSTPSDLRRGIQNTLGQDIGPIINQAANAVGLDPSVLLALLKAESGLDSRAERWGTQTAEARAAIAQGNHAELERIIAETWPDISFGGSQRIVLFHDLGDRTPSVSNCLAVREAVFSDPASDIAAAARRLAGNFQHPTCDGSALSAMVVYNAGSDRRTDPEWKKAWAGNVANYAEALAWAKQFFA
jgi:LysM domain